MSMDFCIQQMKSLWWFGNDIELRRKFSRHFLVALEWKFNSNTDIDWVYIAWNARHAVKFCLPTILSSFKGVSPLHSYNVWSFWDDRAGKWRLLLWMFTQRHIRYVKRHFIFRAIGYRPNFGSSDFIGSLRVQSEITLNGMSLDQHNGVNSLDLILIRLPENSLFDWIFMKVADSLGKHITSYEFEFGQNRTIHVGVTSPWVPKKKKKKKKKKTHNFYPIFMKLAGK